ncbi:UNKNOWN [Stylonychia lemnae]|uniref:Uncharacterized protein n=1 Tax=Stylonychia lemnae TaxID=5949 RepID=A0A077ZY44_STYLE|nr:UNKNOWN [Stylonychia lemnae]|eukprot:CDW74800.1 UNKNOWN [Stylonychia lemnae]
MLKRNLLVNSTDICFSSIPVYQSPQILGGMQGMTQFNCLDYDANNKQYLVAGTSQSSDIVNQTPSGIVVQIDQNTGVATWNRQIKYNVGVTSQIQPTSISYCTYQETSPSGGGYIIIISESPNYSISVLLKSNGNLIQSWYEYDTTQGVKSQRSAIGAKLSSSGNKLSITKIKVADGTSQFTLTISNSDGPATQTISRINYFQEALTGQDERTVKLRSSAQDIVLIYIQEILGIATLQKSWYFTTTAKSNCLDVAIDAASVYTIFNIQNSLVYGGSFLTSLSSSISLLPLRLSTLKTQTLFTQSAKLVAQRYIMVGSTTQINNQVYDKKQAFIYEYPNSNINLEYVVSSVNAPVQVQTIFVQSILTGTLKIVNGQLLTLQPSNEAIQLKTLQGISLEQLQNINVSQLPSTMLAKQNQGIITNPPVQSIYTYRVNETKLKIQLQDFTYSKTCIDAYWEYKASLQEDSNLPSFIKFTQNNYDQGSQFEIYTQDNQTANTYQIKLKATITKSFSSTIFFSIIINPLIPNNYTNTNSSNNNTNNNSTLQQ